MTTLTRVFYLLITLLVSPFATASLSTDKLIERIDMTQTKLLHESQKITEEKNDLARKIHRVQQDVSGLRKEAENIQRLADERLMSLESMKSRAEKWQQQLDYQKHLLTTFAETVSMADQIHFTDSGLGEAKILDLSIDQLERFLNPDWETEAVATKSGEIIHSETIQIGPTRWYYSPQDNQGGLYNKTPNLQPTAYYEFSGNELENMADLRNNNEGRIVFDPTMGRAIELIDNQESVISHLEKGGIWVTPILFFGFLSFLISTWKFVQISRLPRYSDSTNQHLESLMRTKDVKLESTFGKLFRSVKDPLIPLVEILMRHGASDQRDDLLVAGLNDHRHKIEKYLDVISMTAAVAPLLGLLGTVSGMIETFKMLTLFGSGDPAAISGGISEALVTTELGLIVAIPSLIINALLSRKTKSHMHRMETTVIRLNTLRV